MKKIVVIGANEFQLPLIRKINDLGYESHVIAWEEGAVAKEVAYKFYPVSITEKERILKICKDIEADAILTAGSDLATITVNYVANKMNLIGNSEECTLVSTNKYMMREKFLEYEISSPKFIKVTSKTNINSLQNLQFPLIVKPTDRSGSRGITKVENQEQLEKAVKDAIQESFSKQALIEEYIEGNEYSVEAISFKGHHEFLNITQKFTTGSPHFIETMHIQPDINKEVQREEIIRITFCALDALGIEYGASHTELKITPGGEIKIIEIGARMGGDYIGSHLVQLSTGYDFLKGIIDVSLGIQPKKLSNKQNKYALVKFIFSENDMKNLDLIKRNFNKQIYKVGNIDIVGKKILSSADRYGAYILNLQNRDELNNVLKVIEYEGR